jgi:hypothetical protein
LCIQVTGPQASQGVERLSNVPFLSNEIVGADQCW